MAQGAEALFARGDKCQPGNFAPGHLSYPGICPTRASVYLGIFTRATWHPGKKHPGQGRSIYIPYLL